MVSAHGSGYGAQPMRRSWGSLASPLSICALSIVVAGLIVGTEFPAGGNDDSHITYFSAHALAKYGEILSYNGTRVEQSSSLTFVVVLALAHVFLGISLPTLGWVLSLLFGALAISLSYMMAKRDAPRASAWCPLLLASFLPFLYWSSSGMEMTLVASLGGALAILASNVIDRLREGHRAAALLAVVALLFALSRPETPLELVAAAGLVASSATLLSFRNSDESAQARRKRALLFLAGSVAGVAVIAWVRYLVFGLLVPNSAAAKTGAMSLDAGASYLVQGLELANPALPLFAGIGSVVVLWDVFRRRAPTSAVFTLGWGLAATGFVLGSGGDWMPGARLLAPLGVPLAYLTVRAVEPTFARIGRWAHVVPAALVVFNVVHCHEFASSRANNSYTADRTSAAGVLSDAQQEKFAFSELANKPHRRDAKLVVALMDIVRRARPTPEDPLYLMSGQAGMIPFHVFKEFYGSVRFLDLYALTSPELLACIPPHARHPQVHGVRIGASYVIEHADEMDESCGARRPDIVFSVGRFPKYLRDRGYQRAYQGPRDLEAFIAVDPALLAAKGR
jgi:hypothetical protein